MGEELAIYFAAAVRGGGSRERLAARIEALSTLGHVVTEHMASSRTIDIGDDVAIWAHDQALLAKSNVLIADVAVPSTGTGYMIARAAARGLPVLCQFEQGQRASAMIAGSPDLATAFYEDDADFLANVRAFLVEHAARLPASRVQRIFLAGPPGSGKGTLGRWLAEAIGAPHISTGDLLRELVSAPTEHPHRALIMRCMTAGELVPAAVMRDVVIERLARADCKMLGMVLDGYPPSLEDLDNLTAHGVAPDLVLLLECSDDTAVARQLGRNARATDTEEGARKRLAVYHEKLGGFGALATRWYPNSLIARVDAEQAPEHVAAFALQTVRNALHRRRHPRSYFPIPPARPADARSTRLHFHVDAKDARTVHDFAIALLKKHKAAQGQIKVYPIEHLHLGPQHGRLPIYPQLPNFHAIENADDEAFITGRLGDGDRALMTAALELGRERRVMVELEEYVGEWTIGAGGDLVADSSYTLTGDDHEYPAFADKLCTDIPLWELHHGFDLPKHGEDAPPWRLSELIDACKSAGLENGGWFVFKHDLHWAYRSNEFSSASQAEAQEKLFAQARALHEIIGVPIGCSLERVHGIWIF